MFLHESMSLGSIATEDDYGKSALEEYGELRIADPVSSRPMLRSLCKRTRAMYGLMWSYSSGRLCVTVAWAEDANAQSFIAESCKVMLIPGDGAAGRLFKLQSSEDEGDVKVDIAEEFERIDIAKLYNVQSVLVTPWGSGRILELGSSEMRWQPPTCDGKPDGYQLLPSIPMMGPRLSAVTATVWEAVLWKRSRHLYAWRQRYMRLTPAPYMYELNSYDVGTGRLTDTWLLEKSLPYLRTNPQSGFEALIEIDDLALAADTAAGVKAIEELATIFNGAFMRSARSPEKATTSDVRWSCAAGRNAQDLDGFSATQSRGHKGSRSTSTLPEVPQGSVWGSTRH